MTIISKNKPKKENLRLKDQDKLKTVPKKRREILDKKHNHTTNRKKNKNDFKE